VWDNTGKIIIIIKRERKFILLVIIDTHMKPFRLTGEKKKELILLFTIDTHMKPFRLTRRGGEEERKFHLVIHHIIDTP
jgi:hypothetical protein